MGRPPTCNKCNKPKRPPHRRYRDAEGYCECGRPTKFTPEVVQKLKDAFAIDCTDRQACKYAEISESVFYKWQAENPEFVEQILAMREALPIKAKENIARRIHGQPTTGDIGLSRWLVERKEGEPAKTLNLKHSGNVSNVPLADGQDPEVQALNDNYLTEHRKLLQRRADEDEAKKTSQNGQNTNSRSSDQLVNHNRGNSAGVHSPSPVPPADPANPVA